MECYAPVTMLQHSGTAEAAEVSISIETVRATLVAVAVVVLTVVAVVVVLAAAAVVVLLLVL